MSELAQVSRRRTDEMVEAVTPNRGAAFRVERGDARMASTCSQVSSRAASGECSRHG